MVYLKNIFPIASLLRSKENKWIGGKKCNMPSPSQEATIHIRQSLALPNVYGGHKLSGKTTHDL